MNYDYHYHDESENQYHESNNQYHESNNQHHESENQYYDVNNHNHKDNMNITVMGYDDGYDGVFSSVLLFSFMTGAFIYFGNFFYLKLVNHFNRNNDLNENINIDKLDNIMVVDNKCNNICSICLEEYKEEELLIKLKCNHMYHKKCLEPWFNNNNNSCPLCRCKIDN